MTDTCHTPSGIACQGVLDLYSQGRCHVFALACADVLGPRITGYRVMFDPEEVASEHETDTDLDVHSVVHVYAILDDAVALDVAGARPLESAEEDCASRFSRALYMVEDMDAVGLEALIQDDDAPELPLQEITAEMREGARIRVREAFPDLAGTDAPSPSP